MTSSSDQPFIAPDFFNAQSIGRSLQEVSVEIIKTESQNVTSRWFHSNKDADLFIWHDERYNIIKQQVSFCGQIVEWNILEGVKTGIVEEHESTGKISGSDLIRFDKQPQKSSIQMASEMVRHIEQLDELEKQALINNFRKAPKLSNIDPAEFVNQYGRKPTEEKAPEKGFWQRLIGALRRR